VNLADFGYLVWALWFYCSPPSAIGDLGRFWLSCLGPLILLLPNTITNYVAFQSFGFEPKFIPETRRAH